MTIRRVAVLGAGTMGSGIAQACAQAGLEVRLRDLTPELVEKGMGRIRGPLEKRVAAGKMARAELDALLSRITPTTDMKQAVGDADLVIEAVFEDLKVKKEVFGEADALAPAGCVFATNTSSLKVADCAAVTGRADRFGGLHFFFPAAVNKLLEVVATDATSPDTMRALEGFARTIGKVPVRTTDSEGFCVNRFFVPWVNESVRLLDDGVADIATIDAAAKEGFEIGMGPFELMNVTGVPISLHAERTLHQAFGDYYEPARGLVGQVEEAAAPWPLEGTVDPARFGAVQARLYGVVFGIASRLVEEGVATVADTDKAAVVGLRWKRGPFAMMNAMGVKTAHKHVAALNKTWGKAFPVAKPLARQAKAGKPWTIPTVRSETTGPVAVVTIDRPDARNALDPGVLKELEKALSGVAKDRAVRAVVLTGEGSSFIAGADIKVMAKLTPAGAKAYARQGHKVAGLLASMPKPTIAAVNGHCFGGGLELALACDLIVVADEAELGLPEVTLGIAPGFGGCARLPRIVGPARAKELIFTGRRIKGAEAVAIGLAVASHPRASLLAEANALAAGIAQNAPLAVAAAKKAIDGGLDAPMTRAIALEGQAVGRLFTTKDRLEGLNAFVERRKASFKGK